MNHKDLDVWKKSMDLVTEIYSVTTNFPVDEKFGIVSQIRRAAVSIPSNIAEGCTRYSDKEVSHFIDIAIGSLAELETQLLISKNLGYIKDDKIMQEICSVGQMLSGLKRHLKSKNSNYQY